MPKLSFPGFGQDKPDVRANHITLLRCGLEAFRLKARLLIWENAGKSDCSVDLLLARTARPSIPPRRNDPFYSRWTTPDAIRSAALL